MFYSLSVIALIGSVTFLHAIAANPIEAGTVNWGRDLDAASEQSEKIGRPVFLLFQEIPGCAGCQKFGREVLSDPLLVEAIEDEFIPVLIYNNRGGMDKQILNRYKEPAWNFQVVRFLNDKGRDIIPRRDRVWTTTALADRMIEALKVSKRSVPKYLELIAQEHDITHQNSSAFAMYCFWTGEMKIGQIEGVIRTEAGFVDGHEVTRVIYDTTCIDLKSLTRKAQKFGCAQKVYRGDQLDGKYRKASQSDQKKQLSQWTAIRRVPNLTDMQLTKINAFAPSSTTKALEWLSPRQREVLKSAMQ